MDKTLQQNRINKVIEAIIKVARGDYSVQIELSGENDSLDSLAMGFNMMVEDLNKTTVSRDELNVANQQLQAGQQQLKAANQQLDASNQQLRATEQQLRASNQQLQASEQQLKASNQQLRELAMIVEQTAEGVAVADLEGKLRFVNMAWAKMHGYGSGDELIGKNLSIFHTEEQMKTDVIPFNNKVKRAGSYRAEVGHMRKDGTAFPTEMSVTLFKDESGKPVGLIGLASDISSRKKAEEKIKVFSSAVENAYDSFVLTDMNGNVIYANESCIKTFGYNPDEITKLNVSQFTANPEDANKIIEELKKKGSWNGELMQVRKNKEEFPAILTTSIVKNDKGNPTAMMGIFRDITERKQMEDNLRLAKTQAEAANEAKSQFLANMSHEIRTPMNAIIGFTELLINEPLFGEQKEKLNIIKESGQNLLSLINDILDFSKIEAGKLDIEIIDCSLGQLLSSIESMMGPKAKEKRIEFNIIENNGLPAQICTDPNRLRQCLVNLTGNAIKFTKQGHVDIKVSLETTDNQSNIRFDVEDTGIGIPEDRQKAIFESFTQADESTSRKFGGTGLGLTITKQLTELLGGELTLTSEAGKGSVFSLEIPAGLDVTKQPFLDRHNIAGHWEDKSDKADKVKFSGKVLVAEDVKTNQMLMKSLLGKMGLEVTIADDGNIAIQKALVEKFDLILMDIHMPNMDGYEATKALRAEGMTTPIIALTANAMGGDDKKCIEAGCDEYLTKPIDRKKLFEILNKYLSPASEEGFCSVVENINAVKNEVDELNNTIRTTESQDDEEIIPWDRLMARGLDEQLIEKVMPTCIEDNRKRLEELTSAVKKANAKDVSRYAHAIKGSAGNIGAVRLSEIASGLERMALEDDLSEAEELLQKITTEFNKLRSFVSKPGWIETAKEQSANKTPVK